MPQIRAEQVWNLTLKDLQIAEDAAIKQSKIQDWGNDPSGWISQGIIKPTTTAGLPVWDGSQAGQFYYDINTNEIFIGISTPPYFQLITGQGTTGTGELNDRILVVKSAIEADNWSGSNDTDVDGTSSIFRLDTDKVSSDGSNLQIYLNGVLQENGSGNDFVLYEEGGVDKIQFTYNLVGPDHKITAIINISDSLVNYATKAYVDNKFFGENGHDHDGIDSSKIDINTSITPTSLSSLIHNIIPSSNAVNLGSATHKFGNIYAEEGHFSANTIYLGNVAISGAGDTLIVSKDGGSTFVDVAVSGQADQPASLISGAGQNVELSSDELILLTSKDISLTASNEITMDGNTIITGDLIVNGNTITIDTQTLSTGDNIILLNKDVEGIPSQNSGIEVNRGDYTNASLVWDETNDVFVAGLNDSMLNVALMSSDKVNNGMTYFNSATKSLSTSSNVTFDGTKITGTITNSLQLNGQDPSYYSASTHTHSSSTLPSLVAGSTSVGFITYNGTTRLPGMFYGGSNNPTATTRLNYDGYLYASRIYNAVYNDIAEFFPKAPNVESKAGMVLVQTADGVKPSTRRGDGAVVGVYSDSFGYALGAEDQDSKLPVGISGRVWVYIEEPCNIGDLLITSDKEGFGTVKRASEDGIGKVFAKVMKEKTDSTPERIEVLILMA